ncbi:MAG: MerR family transcriptional regulator, partial [Chloroflexi bacterium]|nr:MerR family transcriptional regulator [Chloroflexota bacterium]
SMNIGEAAEASKLTPDTIRFYEKKGILPHPPRLASGYRHYTEEHVATLRLAKGLRELELPLAEVAPILRVAHDGTCGEIRESMTRTFNRAISGLGDRIEELEEARDHLSSLLQGLQKMRPKDVAVPGVEACECVRLVAEG